MAHPKRRNSRSRGRKRRSHDALSPANLINCANCQEIVTPHTVCPNCGHYGKKPIIDMEED